tara:strand:+ start:14981 stop:16108 length:1128 start_codon:yes stop_codon:yes gene_type:complete
LKILCISCHVPPSTGGTGTVISNLRSSFEDHELIIFGEKNIEISSKTEVSSGIYYFNSDFKWNFKGKRFLRWIRWFSFPLMLFKLYQIQKKEKFDSILTLYPDDLYLSASLILSYISNIKLFTWFHNTYADQKDGFNKIFANTLEKAVISRSIKIFGISEAVTKHFKSKYKSKSVSTVRHPFKIPDLKKNKASTHGEKKLFLINGSINSSCIEAYKSLFSMISKMDDIELHVYTGTAEWVCKKNNLLSKNIIYKGFIQGSFTDIAARYDGAFLAHSSYGALPKVEYKTIFPTRFVDLVINQIPTIAYVPKDTYIHDFISKYNCAYLCQEEYEIKTALKNFSYHQYAHTELFKNMLKVQSLFDRDEIKENLKREMR